MLGRQTLKLRLVCIFTFNYYYCYTYVYMPSAYLKDVMCVFFLKLFEFVLGININAY